MKKIFLSLLALISVAVSVAQNYGNGLPATDALNRTLPDSEQVGEPRKGKFVGLFYWTWHTNFSSLDVCIPSRVIAQHPEAAYDFNHSAWDKSIHTNFWGEPLFGFYRDTDRWVLRKHAELLAEAGVDMIMFDCTNGSFTWRESYTVLCEVFAQARRDGVKTPQIAFMLAFAPTKGSREAIISIYEDLYKPGKYDDLFFKWRGKPLIMAYPEMLADIEGDEAQTRLHREIRNYFTFRPGQPVYNVGPTRNDHWGWLEIYPQHGFAKNPDGSFEQVTVGVSQNWTAHQGLSAMNTKGAFGRSYTNARGHDYSEGAVDKGLNFAEQWQRALELDPELIFITGWNEWIMGRFEVWQNQANAFPDQFDQEHSRDIEPMRGGHGDNYFYQMVDGIRRFKGVPSVEKASPAKHIDIDGDFSDWSEVQPEFRATRGNTIHRDSKGWGDYHYTNTSGRNDIVATKVQRDKKNIYFQVVCAEPITEPCAESWLNLYIDIDRSRKSGWEGYDYLVCNHSPAGRAMLMRRSADKSDWSSVAEVEFRVEGSQMEIAIPRKALDLDKNAELEFEFKWVDNMQRKDDIYEFYLSGDAAPIGRFNFVYSTK